MTNFLIVEPRSSGHLLVYVRVLAEFACRNGDLVTIAVSPEAFSSREMEIHLSAINVRTIVVDTKTLLSVRGIELLSIQEGADFVIVPHADEIAPRIALRLGYRGGGRARLLIMRDPRWETPTPLRRRLRNLLKQTLLTIASKLSRVDLIWLRQPNYAPFFSELFAVDPFVADGTWNEIRNEGDQIRLSLNLDPNIYWFGVTGAITERKNLPIVLEALDLLAEKRRDIRFGLAVVGPMSSGSGHVEASIRAACERIGIECRVNDQLLTNFEMNAVVSALDAIVMAYSSFSPNSTLGKAWVLGARIVVAGPPSVQAFARALNSRCVSELTPQAVANSMERALGVSPPPPHYEDLTADEFAAAVLGINLATARMPPHISDKT